MDETPLALRVIDRRIDGMPVIGTGARPRPSERAIGRQAGRLRNGVPRLFSAAGKSPGWPREDPDLPALHRETK
jgi:hypothetical protein